MPIQLNPAAVVFTVGAAVLGGAVAAQSVAQAESVIAKAVSTGTLKDVVAQMSKSNSCEFIARALFNENVSYEEAIAALLAAELPPETVSRCLQGAVSASEQAALDKAMLMAGLPLAETGAGGFDSGSGGGFGGSGSAGSPAPFVGPTIGIGSGVNIASQS